MTFNTTSIMFFALALLCVLWRFRKPTWDLFSPGRLYNVVWFSCIGITLLQWSDLQMDWTGRSYFYILSSIAAFQLGNVLGKQRRRPRSRGHQISPGVSGRTKPGRMDVDRFCFALSIIAVVWLIAFQLRTHEIKGLPILSGDTEIARKAFISPEGSALWKIGTHLCFLAQAMLVLSIYALLRFKNLSLLQKLLAYVVFLGALTFPFVILSRGQLIFPAIVCIALLNYVRKRIRVHAIAWIGAVFLIIMIVIPWYRHFTSGGFRENFTYYIGKMNIPKEYAPLSQPYVMVALSVDNLIQLFETPQEWTYGLLTLRPLWTITGIKSMWLQAVRLPFEWGYGFNTATYLFPFFYDFAYPGLVVFPFIMGMICARLYPKVLRGNAINTMAYAFVVAGMCGSVFDNVFSYMEFWQNMAACCLTLWYAQKLDSKPVSGEAVPPLMHLDAGELSQKSPDKLYKDEARYARAKGGPNRTGGLCNSS